MQLGSSSEDWTASENLIERTGYGYVFVNLSPTSKEKVEITCSLK
jgi:hypothetical protein